MLLSNRAYGAALLSMPSPWYWSSLLKFAFTHLGAVTKDCAEICADTEKHTFPLSSNLDPISFYSFGGLFS